MVWEKFKEVKRRVEDLTKENEKFGQILDKYRKNLSDELGTSEEWEDVKTTEKQFNKIKEELDSLRKKASEDIVIEFVGGTSSGKSSLINCLLREDRLPVDQLQSTMCSIHVCTTPSNQWKVEVDGKQLEKGDDKEGVTKLLNTMSDAQSKQERKNRGITKKSVVKVYWPEYLCTRLPVNIVLVDTPGYGEDPKSTKIVTDSCKTADIIVAVTNIMSPNLDTVSSVFFFLITVRKVITSLILVHFLDLSLSLFYFQRP